MAEIPVPELQSPIASAPEADRLIGTEPKLQPINLGYLPIAALRKIGINLMPGEVIFSIVAQKHARTRHPADYEECLALLALAVKDPTHVGQEPDHQGRGFELIYRSHNAGTTLLAAIKIAAREDGKYTVSSIYPLSDDTLERRLRKGFVIVAK